MERLRCCICVSILAMVFVVSIYSAPQTIFSSRDWILFKRDSESSDRDRDRGSERNFGAPVGTGEYPFILFPGSELSTTTTTTTTTTPATTTTTTESPLQKENPELFRLCPQLKFNAEEVVTQTRYDESQAKCGTVGYREHCPENMVFYSYPQSKVHGQCDCIYEIYDAGDKKPFVYNAKHNKCFQVFEQGYCAPLHWIAPDHDGQPVCTRHKCLQIFAGTQRQNSSEFVLFKDECVRLNKPFHECENDEVIGFYPDDLEPYCKARVIISIKGVGTVKSLKCAPGTYLSITGKCQKGYSWN